VEEFSGNPENSDLLAKKIWTNKCNEMSRLVAVIRPEPKARVQRGKRSAEFFCLSRAMGRHEVLSVVFSIENNALLPGKKITLNIGI
jgi:hypothetical protein